MMAVLRQHAERVDQINVALTNEELGGATGGVNLGQTRDDYNFSSRRERLATLDALRAA